MGALRMALSSLHLGVAAVSFIRPPMVELIPGYAGFAAITNTTMWGVIALTIGLGLLLIPRGQPLLILWQTGSATFFILFAILVTAGPTGLTWGSVVYGLLGLWSAALSFATADDWFRDNRWPQRLRAWMGRIWERHGRP